MQLSSAAKPTLTVIHFDQSRVAREDAKKAQEDLEKTRLESLAKALKERCFLLEQCLVQERKDTHRLRHELSIAKKVNKPILPEEVQKELASLRALVDRQADLIERLHYSGSERGDK